MNSLGDPYPKDLNGWGDRIFAFVDADNVKYSLDRALRVRDLSEAMIEKCEIGDFLTSFRGIYRYYIYSAVEKHAEPDHWLADLRSQSRFVLRQTMLATTGVKSKQEGVDVRLAVEAISGAHKGNFDVCVIFSDDGDLIPLIDSLVDLGIRVIVFSFGNPYKSDVAARIRDAADVYFHVGTNILTWSFLPKCKPTSYCYLENREVDDLLDVDLIETKHNNTILKWASNDGITLAKKFRNRNWIATKFDENEDAEFWFRISDEWNFSSHYAEEYYQP